MTKTIGMTKRILAWVLAVTCLLVAVPTCILSVNASEDTRIADTSTMDDWKQYFGEDVLSTENAGGVWTDKSAFTEDDVFEGTGVTLSGIDNDSFLVALSAIASNKAVSGYSKRPTDTVMMLDVSGSMNTQSTNRARDMVKAANAAIGRLLEGNPYNRVGVVLYSGDAAHETNDTAAQVVLPLGRYFTADDGQYLQYVDGIGGSVCLDEDVRDADNGTAPRASSKEVAGATYIQKGLILGMDQLLAADTVVTDAVYNTVTRVPVMMLLSDGAPTLASTAFTDPMQYDLGDGRPNSSNSAQGFVTQLTAAYAKAQVETHYRTACKFYTLGLGEKNTEDYPIALSVLDPLQSTNTIASFWTQYERLEAGDTMTVQSGETPHVVTKIGMPLEKNYVDHYFEASGVDEQLAQAITDAFLDIVGEIQLQSDYLPTLVETDENNDGYISFVDRIGRHMEVTDIKGILLDNTLYSGEMLSKNFVPGGGDLGTFDAPTALGHEMVAAVRDRIGIATHEETAALIGLAFQQGQIAYNKQTGEYSNYIGWYANAAEEFLGFWYDGITTMPDPSDPTLTDATRPAYIMKSYGFLGYVDETEGVAQSDMMYVIVQERRELATGDTLIAFGVPASLIPVVTYTVELEEDNTTVRDLTVSGAEHPIRLIYEVGLSEDISEYTVSELVEDTYAYRTADGAYRFYANQWEPSTAYGTTNAYSYFVPSKQNERYYYTEDEPLYSDTQGTLYVGGQPNVNDEYYRAHTVYSPSGTDVVYEKMSSLSIGSALESVEGYWYVPAGTVHTYMDGFICDKLDNMTDTLGQYNIPFVDARYNYYVGATFGNNGVVSVTPATGMLLSATLTETVKGANDSFTFSVTDSSDKPNPSAVYNTLLLRADGTQKESTLRMVDGKAQVVLKADERLYIVGMQEGDRFEIRQAEHETYKLHTVNGKEPSDVLCVTIEEGLYQQAAFENTPKIYGDLILIGRVTHDFGASYDVPYKTFDIRVDLGAEFAGQTIRALSSADKAVSSVTADKNGAFTVSLANGQRFELLDLLEGTTATVTELQPPTGFTPQYYVSGVLGDGVATVRADATVSVIIANRYTPTAVSGESITVGGTKTISGRENEEWTSNDRFTMQLETYTSDNGWETIATRSVDSDLRSYDFSEVFALRQFDAPGEYSFRITEQADENTDITYDITRHGFTVVVGDESFDGQLCIQDVLATCSETVVSGSMDDGFVVRADFANVYGKTGRATALLDIHKEVNNPSNSDLVTVSGYQFGLYENGADAPTFVSEPTDAVGDTILPAVFTAPGTYTYSLKELHLAAVRPGMLYSEEEYAVEIVVTEQSDGSLLAQPFVYAQHELVQEIVFTNTYAPSEAAVAFPVTAIMNGRELREGECTIRIEENGDLLATGTNQENGTVVFDNTLQFDTVGDIYLNVYEDVGQADGVTYDTFIRRVHIHVADSAQGYLVADYHLINETGETIDFVNIYKPRSTALTLSGTKTLVGRRLLNDEFDFVLIENALGGRMMNAKNKADGSFAFDPIIYDEVGNYEYWIQEAKAGDPNGIVYDMTEYTVKVCVTDNGNGELRASIDSITDGNITANEISFENIYQAHSTQVTFDGKTTLSGRALKEKEFSFALYEFIGGERRQCLQTTTNAADGSFAFEPITYQAAGVYRYVVEEVRGGQTIDGVQYDDAIYHVVVYVEEDGHGNLVAEQVIIGDDDLPVDTFVFDNQYTVSKEAVVTLQGQVVLEGRAMLDGEFAFLLYEYAQDGTLSAEPIARAAANADGEFAFDAMSYQGKGEHLYRIVQDNAASLSGVTYDAVTYDVYFSVRDGKDGSWKASKPLITVTNGTSSVEQVLFTNTYTPGPDEITVPILVEKTVHNTGDLILSAEGFVFEMRQIESGESFKVTTDAHGKATFQPTFTKADAGKTYTYEIAEINDGRADVTYSTVVYTVTVTVTLDAFGELSVSTLCNEEETQRVCLAFENTYHATTTQSTPVTTTTVTSPVTGTTTSVVDTAKPDGAKDDAPFTGERADTTWWMLLMLSGVFVVMLGCYRCRKSNG